MAEKQITLEIPSDAPTWSHRLFAGLYEMRVDFRQHLSNCRDQHDNLRRITADPLGKFERWLKLILMIAALVGGYLAIHDLKLAKSNPAPPPVVLQSPPPPPAIIYIQPDSGPVKNTTTTYKPRRRPRSRKPKPPG